MKEDKALRILKELIRDSKRSDREVAKAIGTSQPTVTRNRKLLNSYIRSYTIIPEFSKIGYEILALTFAKARTYDKEEVKKKLDVAKKWVEDHPCVIFASDGEGLGKDAVMISLHRNYSKYADFMREYAIDFSDFIVDIQSFIVSLNTGIVLKPLDMTYLGDDIHPFT
jgi:DNA-binding Lrp family transcriptional regulator